MKLKGFPFVKGRKASILIHRQADIDAVASAIGLKKILEEKGFSVSVPEPKGISLLTKAFMENVGFKFRGGIRGADVIIIADTGNPQLLEGYLDKLKRSKAFKILVDHHPYDPSFDFVDRKIIDVMASSTSEIVYRIAKVNHILVDKFLAKVLLAGIIFDSQYFNIAGCRTFGTVKELCNVVGNVSEARSLITQKRDVSEVIARLKAGQRAKIFRTGNFIIVISRLSSFHSSAARHFIDAGADFAAVIGESDGGCRGSFRSSRKLDLHLGKELARALAEVYGGTGGGHPTAASFSVKARPEEVEEYIIKVLEEKLGRLEELKK